MESIESGNGKSMGVSIQNQPNMNINVPMAPAAPVTIFKRGQTPHQESHHQHQKQQQPQQGHPQEPQSQTHNHNRLQTHSNPAQSLPYSELMGSFRSLAAQSKKQQNQSKDAEVKPSSPETGSSTKLLQLSQLSSQKPSEEDQSLTIPPQGSLSFQAYTSAARLMAKLPVHSPSPFLRAQGIVTVVPKSGEKITYPVPPPHHQNHPNHINYYTAAQAPIPSGSTTPVSNSTAPSNESLSIGSSNDSTGGPLILLPNNPLPDATLVTSNPYTDHGIGSAIEPAPLPKLSASPLSIANDDLQCMEDMIPFAPTPQLPPVPILTPMAPLTTTSSTNDKTNTNSQNSTATKLTLTENPKQNSTLSETLATRVIPIQNTSTTLLTSTTTNTHVDSNDATKDKQLSPKKLILQQKEIQQRIQNQMQEDQKVQQQLQHRGYSLHLAGSTKRSISPFVRPIMMDPTVLAQSFSSLSKPRALHQLQPQYQGVSSSVKRSPCESDGSVLSQPQSKPDKEGLCSYPKVQTHLVSPMTQSLSVLQTSSNGSGTLSSHANKSTEMKAESFLMKESSPLKPGMSLSEEPVSGNGTVKSTKIGKIQPIPRRPHSTMTTTETGESTLTVQNQRDFYNMTETKTLASRLGSQDHPVPKLKTHQKKNSVSSRTKSQRRSVMPSAKLIADSIPSNASAVFHIFDRRINLDSHDSNTSFYSLLRSWVQDDPYRKSVHSGSRLLDHVSLSYIYRDNSICEADMKMNKRRSTGMSEVKVLPIVKGNFESSSPDTGRLLFDHVKRAKRRKMEVQRQVDEKMNRSNKHLQGIGIFL